MAAETKIIEASYGGRICRHIGPSDPSGTDITDVALTTHERIQKELP